MALASREALTLNVWLHVSGSGLHIEATFASVANTTLPVSSMTEIMGDDPRDEMIFALLSNDLVEAGGEHECSARRLCQTPA